MDLLINIYHCREIPILKLCLLWAVRVEVCPISEWDALAQEEVSRLVFGQQEACSLGRQLTVGQMME